MIRLEPFTKNDFDRLIHWISSKRELALFAGPIFSYPLTRHQLDNYLKKEGLEPKKVIENTTGKVIGHCELNFSNEIPRLSRILIGDKSFRGKGIGKQLVRLMIKEILKIENTPKLDLKVFQWNENVVRLYQDEGFKIQPEHTYEFEFTEDEFWTSLYMVKTVDKEQPIL